jgi:hypothetical protein
MDRFEHKSETVSIYFFTLYGLMLDWFAHNEH